MASPFLLRIPALGLLAGCALLAACRTVPGPEVALEAYARALKENRLDDAYALTSPDTRAVVSRDAFFARYENPARREARAQVLLSGLDGLRVCAPDVEAVRSGEAWLVRELPSEEAARRVLAEFLDASEKGDFERAYRLLSASLRARYTPERFAKDFAAEPLAKEKLARAREALAGELVLEEGRARFPLGEGKAVQLVREGGTYRVAALE